jgi:hypothetical protein
MSVDVQWTDEDPDTGEKRFVRAERFAKEWKLYVRHRRRERWLDPPRITRDMWEALLAALERRIQRAEGVTEADLKFVRKALADLRDQD